MEISTQQYKFLCAQMAIAEREQKMQDTIDKMISDKAEEDDRCANIKQSIEIVADLEVAKLETEIANLKKYNTLNIDSNLALDI